MDEKDVVSKMQGLIGKSKMAQTNKPVVPSSINNLDEEYLKDATIIEKQSLQDWLKTLPAVVSNQFLLAINTSDGLAIFCVKELDWQTAMNIDMKSYRLTEKDVDYYSEEYERRNTLNRAIVWVADSSSQIVAYNQDGYILERLEYSALDVLWYKYRTITSVTTQEAQKLYEATRKYLNNEAQEGVPIPSIVPETIAICDGWSSLSSKELKELTAGDWERMQIIRMARADLMGVYTTRQVASTSIPVTTNEISEEKDGFDFENWRNHFPVGHPNRPPGI